MHQTCQSDISHSVVLHAVSNMSVPTVSYANGLIMVQRHVYWWQHGQRLEQRSIIANSLKDIVFEILWNHSGKVMTYQRQQTEVYRKTQAQCSMFHFKMDLLLFDWQDSGQVKHASHVSTPKPVNLGIVQGLGLAPHCILLWRVILKLCLIVTLSSNMPTTLACSRKNGYWALCWI